MRTKALHQQYAQQIFNYCLRRLRSREEAEDAAQIVFLNAHRCLEEGVEPTSERAWLFKIAEHVVMYRRRTISRRARVEFPADVDTLTSYGRGRGLVHLRDRSGRMKLLAFPRGRSRTEIGPGESVRSVELRNGWRLVVKGKRKRRYSLQASLATLHHPFVVCAVNRGKWTYNRRTRVLRASFKARSATLSVRGC